MPTAAAKRRRRRANGKAVDPNLRDSAPAAPASTQSNTQSKRRRVDADVTPQIHDSDQRTTTTQYPHIPAEYVKELQEVITAMLRERPPVDDKSLGKLWISLNGVLNDKGILLDSNKNAFIEKARRDAKLRKDCEKAIRSHVLDDLLRNSSIIRIERVKNAVVPVNPLLQSAVEKDFGRPYVGQYATFFVDSINKTLCSPDNQGGYSNLGSIIQSSGYGKSRMVDEVSENYFTLPFNVRPEEQGSYAYPPADDSVRDFFAHPMTDSDNVRLRDSLFFRHLFLLTQETLDADLRSVKGQALPHAWRDWLKQTTHPGWGEDRRRRKEQPTGRRVNRSVLYEEAIHRALQDFAGEALDLAIRKLEETVIELLKRLGALKTTGLTLFLYFDEVHSLFCAYGDTVGQTRWDILCSTLASITNAGYRDPGITSASKVAARTKVFCLSLSTASHFPVMIRPKHMASSARAAHPDVNLFAPYTTTPFDIKEVDPGEVAIVDLEKISSLAKLGRPLWSVLRENPQQLMHLAIGKLSAKPVVSYKAPIHTLGPSLTEAPRYTNSSVITDNEDNFVPESLFAAMSTRVLIDIEPQRETARRLISTLVCNHLRTVFMTPAHREYMRTGTPSEPILAEAAAVIMHESRVSMIGCLETMLTSNLIGKGERGELVARALLIMAVDRAIHMERLRPDAEPLQSLYVNDLPVYHRTVSVKSFINALLAEDYQNVVLNSTPQNISLDDKPVTFEEAFEHGYVCFTHFTRMKKATDMTNTSAYLAFTRGAALQFCTNHETWDIGIPVAIFDVKFIKKYGGVERVPLSRARWTMLLFSIKAKGTKQPASYTMDPDRAGFWTELPPQPPESESESESESQNENEERTLHDSIPVAVVLMELGITGDRARSRVEAKAGPSRKSLRNRKITHPRYAFTIVGCSSSVYGVIDPSEKDSYRAVLSAGTLLDEHPRSDHQGIVQALEAAKPTLSSNVNCWSYVAPKWLKAHKIQGWDKMEEELDVDNGWVEACGFGDEDDSQADTDLETNDTT